MPTTTVSSRLIIFAKAPIPGQVKTRLIDSLGSEGAANLHRHLVSQVFEIAAHSVFPEVDLWCSPSINHKFFKEIMNSYAINLHSQAGNNLGERMSHAFATTLEHCAMAVIIGTDCPSLTPQYLQGAIEALIQGNDAVLGPAEDGGYILLGLKRHSAKVFDDIDWGTDKVLSTTRERFRQLGWQWQELTTLRDIDRPEDVDFFSSQPRYKHLFI